MNEFDIKAQEIFEKKLLSNYKMTLNEFKELDDYTKDILIKGMYILKDNSVTVKKDKIKRI